MLEYFLLAGDDKGPSLAIDRPGRQIWLDQDAEFRVPRANQTFTLGIEGGLDSPWKLVRAELYQRLVSDALTQYAYPAMLAGLGYQIGTHASGFRLQVSGYSDKQIELLDRILAEFAGLELNQDRFDLNQAELVREWRNIHNQRPYTQSYAALSNLLLDTSFDPDTLASELAGLTLKDLESWRQNHLGRLSVVGLSHGNLDQAALDKVDALLDRHLTLAEFSLRKPELVEVDEAWLLELEVDHDDASMVLYVQDTVSSFESRAKSALTAQILRQAYFASLRTEQQLGYVVSMGNRTIRNRGGLVFIIQSPVASPAALEAATVAFIREQLPLISSMDQAAFEQFKVGLISQLTEKAKNLRERSARYLADLEADVTSFDSQQQIADVVATLTREDVAGYLELTVQRLTDARVLIYNLGKFDESPSSGKSLSGRGAFKS